MRKLATPPDEPELALVSRLEALGGIADFRLLRFAAERRDFTTGEATRAIGSEPQSAVDRRAERLVGTMLRKIGTGAPKRFAATPRARREVAALQKLARGARIGNPPSRLICVRATAAVDPSAIAATLSNSAETYDADGPFMIVGVFDDEPHLVRDLMHRLHEIGAEAEEIRIAAKRT
jgi:hypothetical protein